MAQFECPGCGASLTTSDKECKYCGLKNANYKVPESKPIQYNNQSQPATNYYNYNQNNSPAKSEKKINWLAFFILLILFWPAALIYIVVKNNER